MMLNEMKKTMPFIGCDAGFEGSRTVIFGAPYDGTSSFRPGSRFAPSEMRSASDGIETYSPYQEKDLVDAAVHDTGDIDMPFGNRERALALIAETAAKIISCQKRFFMIGGEHLVSLPAISQLLENYPDLCVIHFDAHADLRSEYIGEPLSHATVMRRIWDKLGDGRIWQYGIRSGTREEFQFAHAHTKMETFGAKRIAEAVSEIGSRSVYLSVDLDVMDPSVMPGTGTPETGGMTSAELINALIALKGLKIVGADIVELSPHYDPSGSSTLTACTLAREILILLSSSDAETK
jgi:agmatinase